MKFDSPLRYPGGKSSLAGFLARTIELNNLHWCSYFEPFAGGAGAALRLLREGVVSDLHLNDLDPCVNAFWNSVLCEPERFADDIMSVPVNVEEWKKQREICRLADLSKPFELGFATFYLNRCNRSGIIRDAGPIGGYDQAGKWSIDSRFYRKSLAERIIAVGKRREQIHIANMEARDFLVERLPREPDRESVFVYLDPPYYANGNRLYMNFYGDQEHKDLAQYIQGQDNLYWVMSYDNTDFIRTLYEGCEIRHQSIDYTLERRRAEQELIISPSHVQLPGSAASIGT